MLSTLHNKLSIIYNHIFQYKNSMVYLKSDRTTYIKLKIKFQTGSAKNVTGHVKFYRTLYGGVHHTSGIVSSVRRALTYKLRGPGFKA